MSVNELERRIQRLQELKSLLETRESDICEALWSDLRKPKLETYVSEIAPVRHEINFTIAHLKTWTKAIRVPSPQWTIGHFLAKAEIRHEPRGNVLILSPWNYPLNLSLMPLVGAIAAGNHVTLKPSELAPATEALIASMFKKPSHLSGWIDVQVGGADRAAELLSRKWDLIFFTGSTTIGKKVMEAAAKHLSPVVLELGGKCPAIFDQELKWEIAVKRLMWGKVFNAGQTCVAPDYVFVPEEKRETFLHFAKNTISKSLGRSPEDSPDYARIINHRHFDRLMELMQCGQVLLGGRSHRETRFIEPTIIENAHGALLDEEIFGPLLLLKTYKHLDEAFQFVRSREKPLALYIFSESRNFQNKVLHELQSGGACINDTLIHLSHPHLPFGGIGCSGMGSYHGKKSFEVFSHVRSVERKPLWGDLALRYPPYKIKLNRFWKMWI